MRRREFIALATGAVVWPVVAGSKSAYGQAGKVWRMGFLAYGPEKFYDALFQGPREFGYEEGRNLIVTRRFVGNQVARFQEFAEELARVPVDVIIVVTTPAAVAAKRATLTIPIVFPNAIDPVGTGVISSLAHPGGNITGGAVLSAETSAKRLELLKEVLSKLSLISVVWNSANPANNLAWTQTQDAARTLGLTLRSDEVRSLNDFEAAFAKVTDQRPDALIALQDALTLQRRSQIIDFCVQQRLPSMFVGREWAEGGGLMSYGDSLPNRYYRAAYFVDKVLKGTKPADLPFEQPTKFELIVNLKTAKLIGLTISEAFLSRADEVIE